MASVSAKILIEDMLCAASPEKGIPGLYACLTIYATGKMEPDGPPGYTRCGQYFLTESDWEIEKVVLADTYGNDLPQGLVAVIVTPDRKQITVNNVPVLTPDNLKFIEEDVTRKLCAADF